VQELARLLALVATDGLGGLEGLPFVEAEAFENAADAGRRDGKFGGDLLSGPAPASQLGKALTGRGRQWAAQPVRPRAAIHEIGRPLLIIALQPFVRTVRRQTQTVFCPSASDATWRTMASISLDPRSQWRSGNRMDNLWKAHT